jgi:hypothetical protein
VTNFVVSLSTMVHFRYAPLITTCLSFIFQSLPIFLVIYCRRNLGLSRFGVFAFVLIVIGLPQAPEVWANSINLQFHFALLAAIIAALEIHDQYPRYVMRVLLALSGLSGIPANFLAPVFLGLAVLTNEKERWIQFGIITATSAIEMSFLIHSDFNVGNRSLSLNPIIYWLAIVNQQTLSPLFGTGRVTNLLTEIVREVLAGEKSSILFAIVCSIPMFYFFRAGVLRR